MVSRIRVEVKPHEDARADSFGTLSECVAALKSEPQRHEEHKETLGSS
jgi:hypothetical protein